MNAFGTSPRTRGKRLPDSGIRHGARNIPAHAGKTTGFDFVDSLLSEHPRARGENVQNCIFGVRGGGTSPRTRGKHLLTCGSSFLKVILHSVLFSRTMGV